MNSGARARVLIALFVISCGESEGTGTAPVVVPKPTAAQEFSIQLAPGDSSDRSDTVLATMAKPLTVLVMRKARNGWWSTEPAVGVHVSWGIVDFSGGSAGSIVVSETTDSAGFASASVTLGSKEGGYQLQASVAGAEGSPVVFRVFARRATPTRLRIEGGDGQVGLVNGSLGAKYVAVITDSYGNDTGGHLDYQVTSGGGSLVEPPCDPEWDWCPPEGWIHVLGPDDGPQTVTATATSLPGAPGVTFTATAVTAVVWVSSERDCYEGFHPSDVSVAPGKTVAWMWCNNDYSLTHNVTFEDGKGSSPTQMEGLLTRTFTAAGTYRYRCTLHSTSFTSGNEVGTVTVK